MIKMELSLPFSRRTFDRCWPEPIRFRKENIMPNTIPVVPLPALGGRSEAVWNSLVSQLQKAVHDAGFCDVVIGLSGGIDSAMVATLAVDAFGVEHVHGILMPSEFSSAGSLTDAEDLAGRLGVCTTTIPITPAFEAFKSMLKPSFGNLPFDVAEENLQARIRGTLLMSYSNKFQWFVLATGNKSEAFMGYATLHGDMVGGYAPLAPLYKMHVYELCEWRRAQGSTVLIPDAILAKEPSAELSPGQLDRHALPPYVLLDAILYQLLEQGLDTDGVVALGFDAETVKNVASRIENSEFKRCVAAPGPSINHVR